MAAVRQGINGMKEKPKHFNVLCSQIGTAILMGQVVENMLAHYIVVNLRLESKAAVQKVQAALSAADQKNLGALLKDIQKQCPLPPDISNRLETFRQERNWLVHRLYREHPLATYREDASKPVFLRVQGLTALSAEIMQALHIIGDSIMTKHGFDVQAINAKAVRDFMNRIGEPAGSGCRPPAAGSA